MIVRTPKRERYVVISKVPLEDKRLSWEARGMLSYLLSKPDGWTVSTAHLEKQASGRGSGRDAVQAILKELANAGYITRQRGRNTGRFAGYEYAIHEEPVGVSPQPAKPVTVPPQPALPAPVQTPLVNNDSSESEKGSLILEPVAVDSRVKAAEARKILMGGSYAI